MSEQPDNENLGSAYMERRRPPGREPSGNRRLPQGVLTAVTLIAFAGILWYAYPSDDDKYTDVDVPLVKADTAPVKADPVDPGGMAVPHRDSTAFALVEKNARDVPERILPSPEQPLDKDSAIPAEVEDVANDIIAIGDDVETAAETLIPLVEAPVAKPVEAPKPPKAEAPKAAPVAVPAPVTTDAAGTHYIQLGSFRDAAGAQREWDGVMKKNENFLNGLAMRTERIDLPGKGVFYRLQAGKISEARAREICDVLKKTVAGGCLVVRP